MKTIQMTIDEELLERVDQVTESLGIPRSAFIRRALELSLKELAVAKMEKKHIEGYERHPVVPGEFDVWEEEQVWGDA